MAREEYDDFGAPPKEGSVFESMTNPDKSYVRYVVDGSDIIERLQTNMLGLIIYEEKDGNKKQTNIVRKYKPIFTDEYAHNFIQNLQYFANSVISTTTFDDEQINMKMMHFNTSALLDIITHGDDHYISSRSWKLILKIHEKKLKTIKNGKEVILSGWARHGIYWEYNHPVTEDMLQLVKDFDEEVEQGIIFRKLLTEISPFVHASMNKSLNHLTTSMLGHTHRISESHSYDTGKNKKSVFGKIFSSGTKEGEQRF